MQIRTQRGNSLLELPVGLWLALIVFVLPCICYATAAYRLAFLHESANRACVAAARQGTFTQAKQTATDTFNGEIHTFNGISNTQIQVGAVAQPLPNADGTRQGQAIESSGPFSKVDTTKYSYYIKVWVAADVDPLVKFGPDGLLGLKFPGLTAPIHWEPTNSAFVEYPQGLMR